MSIKPSDIDIAKEYLALEGLDFYRIRSDNTQGELLRSNQLPHLKIHIDAGRVYILSFPWRTKHDNAMEGSTRYKAPAGVRPISVVAYAYLLQVERLQHETQQCLSAAVSFCSAHPGCMAPFNKASLEELNDSAAATLPGPPEHKGAP